MILATSKMQNITPSILIYTAIFRLIDGSKYTPPVFMGGFLTALFNTYQFYFD